MITREEANNFLKEFLKDEYPDNYKSYLHFEAPNQSNFVRIHYVDKNDSRDYFDIHWLSLLTYIFRKQKSN
jgi:hypothetical protein